MIESLETEFLGRNSVSKNVKNHSHMYTLRPAMAADYDFLYDLHRAALRDYIEAIWGWDEEWQAKYFADAFNPDQRRIIQVDGRDAGVLVVEERPSEIYLNLIELLPGFQGRGVGTAIINDLAADAHGRGLPMTLHVLKANTPARRLYERLGFQVVADEENRYGMEKLPP